MAALLLLAAPAAARQARPPAPSPYDRAIAAGYKAAMLCGAILNARAMGSERTQASVEANELRGIYPQYEPLIAQLPARVGASAVTVEYDGTMPPRIASYRSGAGCTMLPIGAGHPEPPPPAAVSPASKSTPYPAFAGRLAAVADRAFAAGFGARGNTTALLVLRGGEPLGERYADGFGPATPQRTWSVAKSIAGTLAGIAVAQGLLDRDAPAPIPEWQRGGDPRAAITLDQLLRMASGLHSATAGNRTDALYFGGTAVTEETVGWPIEAKPGTRFRYANNDILLAMRALRAKAGRDDFATAMLLAPLGMAHTVAEQDWHGNYMLSSQVWSTARDLARLGEFWRNDGVWAGKRLLPQGWMRYMTAPDGPQPADGPGYGATLWLFGPKQGLPQGSYAAQGNRGQYVMVIPSKRLVIVRRGEDPAGGGGFDIAAFARAAIEAID